METTPLDHKIKTFIKRASGTGRSSFRVDSAPMPDFMLESSIVRQAITRTGSRGFMSVRTFNPIIPARKDSVFLPLGESSSLDGSKSMIWDASTRMRHFNEMPHPGDDALSSPSSPRSVTLPSSPVQGTRKVPVYTKAVAPTAAKIAQTAERGRVHQHFALEKFGLKVARILPPMSYAFSKQNARRQASMTEPLCPPTRFRSVKPYIHTPLLELSAAVASTASSTLRSEEKKSGIDIVHLVDSHTSLILPWRRNISVTAPASIHFPIPERDSNVNYVVEIVLGEDDVVDIEVEKNDEEHEPVTVDIESFGAELRYIYRQSAGGVWGVTKRKSPEAGSESDSTSVTHQSFNPPQNILTQDRTQCPQSNKISQHTICQTK